MKNNKDQRLGTTEVIQKIGVSPERLRYWERLGIVKPKHIRHEIRKFRRYSQEDVHRAILVKTFVDTEKYTLEGAIRKLKEGE